MIPLFRRCLIGTIVSMTYDHQLEMVVFEYLSKTSKFLLAFSHKGILTRFEVVVHRKNEFVAD